MSIFNLDKIFRPSSVAVIGADQKAGAIGYALMHNLTSGVFKGRLFPVSTEHDELWGMQAYSSVSRIGEPVDLALIASPIATVPDIIAQCGEAGVSGAVILTAAGEDIEHERRHEVEAKIIEAASRSCIRLIGPNCPGIIATEAGLNATCAHYTPLPGKLAFVSQSGAICATILDISVRERIGFKYFLGLGGMLDVDFGDLVNYLGNDTDVSSIVLYMERLKSFRKFMSAARSVSRIKPIVVLKPGRYAAAAMSAASHIGAMVSEDSVYDAAFERAGIVRVDTIEELFDCAELMARQPRLTGDGLAIVTSSGGAGLMAADALALRGMAPVALGAQTMERLNTILPSSWNHGNPIDILGSATPETYKKVVEVCISAPEVRSLLIIMAPHPLSDPTAVALSLCELLRGRRLSIFTVWMGAGDAEKGRELFHDAGIPTYETPERAVRAFLYMVSHARSLELLQQTPPKMERDLEVDSARAWAAIDRGLQRDNLTLTETESKELLSAYGIPVNPTQTASSPEEAVEIARRMGYPVVMKIHSRDLHHKREVRGVRLDVQTGEQVRQAFGDIVESAKALHSEALVEGASIQPMIRAIDCELILGAKKDAAFGPVLLFGMGGLLTEIIGDRAIALAPLNRLLARRLMENTRIYRLIEGFRGQPAANLALLEEALIRLSQLVIDFPEIAEIEINPLAVVGEKICALDAHVVVEPPVVPSPMHLAISPYPGHYETEAVTRSGMKILIRPIKPEDAPLLEELFSELSPRTIYYRFFRPLKSLSPDMLARFSQIDYDRDIVLVAIGQVDDEPERIMGVCRLMGDPDVTAAEFAIVVSDRWQGSGVGAELLERCLDIARERGISFVWGVVLAENTTMIGLGRKLGFSVSRAPESSDYILRISLKPEEPGSGSCPRVFE